MLQLLIIACAKQTSNGGVHPMRFPDPLRRLPMRARILLFLVATLGLSLGANLYLGASLVEADKEAYLYETDGANLAAIARELEAQLAGAARLARAVSSAAEGGAQLFAESNADGRIVELH